MGDDHVRSVRRRPLDLPELTAPTRPTPVFPDPTPKDRWSFFVSQS